MLIRFIVHHFLTLREQGKKTMKNDGTYEHGRDLDGSQWVHFSLIRQSKKNEKCECRYVGLGKYGIMQFY